MTKKQKSSKAWKKANHVKYLAWGRGWRSGSGVSAKTYNKRWEAEHKK